MVLVSDSLGMVAVPEPLGNLVCSGFRDTRLQSAA